MIETVATARFIWQKFLEKAIDYVAEQVKKGKEEQSVKKELIRSLEYIDQFFIETIERFDQHYNEKITLETRCCCDEILIDCKKALNICNYLSYDRIFLVESKTIFDHLRECEDERQDILRQTRQTMGVNEEGKLVRHFFYTHERVCGFAAIIQKASSYIDSLKEQRKIIAALIKALQES